MVRRPAGVVALLRVVPPSAGVHHHGSVPGRVRVVPICCAAAVHTEMIEAGT